MKRLFEKVFGSESEREIKKIDKLADRVEALDEEYKKLSDQALQSKTAELKGRLSQGEALDDILPEAFATMREAAWRVLGMKHYRVQIYGAIILHQGRISEMKTGEGKTLMATLPVYLNALAGKGVHVVTVNDYLAQRDCEWMGKLYEFLGLSVGVIVHGITIEQRRAAYNADVTYGTNNEFGFDYLRDNMVIYQKDMVQREQNYAIVDEVDSILIDEARTPLIISGQGEKSTKLYHIVDQFVKTLKIEDDVSLDEKANSVTLTEDGGTKAEKAFGIENLADMNNMELSHHINQALKARNLMRLDKDYVVKDGEIIIVDDFTGRLMFGRRYSDGLHQAIEAKEGLQIQRESKTLATITFQNYFRMYRKLSGMTGTAKTEEDEFRAIYNMDVVEIPTNRVIVRDDQADGVYKGEQGKFEALAKDIEGRYKKGQPVLVGTISIEKSEELATLLKRKGIPCEVLNAKHHEREAEIVAQAGRKGIITIATNMAGRGTDIILGGNPEFLAKREMKKRGYADELIANATSHHETDDEELQAARKVYNDLLEKFKKETEQEHKDVIEAGGLHIIGTERHESRRIDNQLRGRAGRQGDPGSSKFYISLEDDLMRLFGGDKMLSIVEKMGLEDDEAIEHGMLSRSIENAQKKVEGRNFGIRKHVLQYDDVMNKQREVIYGERKKVLAGESLKDHVLNMARNIINEAVAIYTADAKYPEEWDLVGLGEYLAGIYMQRATLSFDNIEELTVETLQEQIYETSEKLYEAKEEEIEAERMRELERIIVLQVIDTKWMDHIDAMDQLRQGIGLRAIGQIDPVRAYQVEGFDMFNAMINSIQEDTVKYLFNVEPQAKVERKQVAKPIEASHGDGNRKKAPVVKEKEAGRNDPCPCGSGKKYKKCCGE
ncbi:preprotein translocase, SecA subunit [Alkaliphilus metalliredigens QYMF]|uniref:Protein translocase subunit SecA 1 n=1 Tax=Alkaliphilus metalliredigens (strain QYMF) TaxID=293826 RepID=SECA1_ALKMQ|nr:preprotein translocase subunit SecA [Alkaliphilus metalliredigens]A6TLE7.1 RecName: Full=Protein translocase subunit SecA 1 [Alkaliphilus metalliredigens QYMF]ABR47015.1 preprotein translocase, SecA subunit [Alkaliphilus metalliredigens QYMF]